MVCEIPIPYYSGIEGLFTAGDVYSVMVMTIKETFKLNLLYTSSL